MTITLKEAISAAFAKAFGPWSEIMLELAVTSPESESLLRSVNTHSGKKLAMRQNAAEGKDVDDVSFGRIALLTGIHRNEVAAKLKDKPQIDPTREQRSYGANRVLKGWHTDVRYMSGRGMPRVLPLAGEASFEELVQQYAPNVGSNVVLDELVRVRAAERLPDGTVRARSDSVASPGLDADGLDEMGTRLRDHAMTLTHNLRQPNQAHLSDTVLSLEVSPRALPLLQRVVRERAKIFLQQIESEFNDTRLRRAKGEERVRVGLTLFTFEEMIEGPDVVNAERPAAAAKKKSTKSTRAPARARAPSRSKKP
jgi:hypothetical protein